MTDIKNYMRSELEISVRAHAASARQFAGDAARLIGEGNYNLAIARLQAAQEYDAMKRECEHLIDVLEFAKEE